MSGILNIANYNIIILWFILYVMLNHYSEMYNLKYIKLNNNSELNFDLDAL